MYFSVIANRSSGDIPRGRSFFNSCSILLRAIRKSYILKSSVMAESFAVFLFELLEGVVKFTKFGARLVYWANLPPPILIVLTITLRVGSHS